MMIRHFRTPVNNKNKAFSKLKLMYFLQLNDYNKPIFFQKFLNFGFDFMAH